MYTWLDPSWTWHARIGDALADFRPWWVVFTENRSEADVVVYHIVGKKELDLLLENYATSPPPPTVVIQHVLETADGFNGDIAKIREAFGRAWRHSNTLLTASFHDFSADAADMAAGTFRFHPMPWGADDRKFVPPFHFAENRSTHGHVLAIGSDPFGESHGEVLFAASHAGRQVRHVGSFEDPVCGDCFKMRCDQGGCDVPLNCRPFTALGGFRPCDWQVHLGFVSDDEFVHEMQSAAYVSALRKTEGFELAGVEGLFCGARPLVYDIPTYRWYRGHAVFMPDPRRTPSASMFDTLVDALKAPARPVTPEEHVELRRHFSWTKIVPTLYEKIRDELQARHDTLLYFES